MMMMMMMTMMMVMMMMMMVDDHDVADCPSQLIYNGISICIKYITNIKPIAGYSANDVVDDNDDNYCRQLI